MTLFYIIIFITSCISIYTKYKLPNLYALAKPIPILLLIGLLAINLEFSNWAFQLTLAALAFSLLGDLALLTKGRFYAGLTFFLIAHLFYFLIFVNLVESLNLLLIIPFLIYISIVVFIFKELDKEKLISISLYSLAISLMGFSAANIYFSYMDQSSFMIITGALLFILSDSVLAFNKFKKEFHSAELLILSTYYLAQTLLISGIIIKCA